MERIFKKSVFLFVSFCLFTLTISSQEVEASQKLPKLIDFGAHKCMACQKMTPVLDELSSEYQGVLDVQFVDVWQHENKEKAMAHNIHTIPTQIFIDAEGKELWRHVGFIAKEDILKKCQELGYIFKTPRQQNSSQQTMAVESE